MYRLPREHIEAADITTDGADCHRDAHFESVISQGIDCSDDVLERITNKFSCH
jgi:hypothetical protein